MLKEAAVYEAPEEVTEIKVSNPALLNAAATILPMAMSMMGNKQQNQQPKPQTTQTPNTGLST